MNPPRGGRAASAGALLAEYPRYSQLSRLERWMIRRLCYWPPRPRRPVIETEQPRDEDGEHQCVMVLGSDFAAQVRGKRVLDVGCGVGAAALTLGGHAELAVGVDPAPRVALAGAAARDRSVPNVSFVRGSAAAFPDGCFDLVISHDAFEHLDDPAGVLREMVRVTKAGGSVVVKFGPTWRGPWGRHMSGTYRKDRPWLHLMFPERSVMRVWSVYNDWPETLEHYAELPGGMNKMTVKRCQEIFSSTADLEIRDVSVGMFRALPVGRIPILKELLSVEMGIRAVRR